MSQQPVTWLASVLKSGGVPVKTYEGWMVRGRPESSGGFDPVGVLIHHTGTATSATRPAPTVPMCIAGRPDLPGPLCQVVLDFNGLWHVIAAGRANHAGTAKPSGPVPGGDGNALYIGIEVDYSGSQDMGPKQYPSLVKGTAAILKKLGRPEAWARGHKETSSAGKWDPGRKGSSSPEYLLGPIREDIKKALAPPPTRYRYLLLDGEGKVLARSNETGGGEAARVARLKSFHLNTLDLQDNEFQQDKAAGEKGDLIIRRVKA